MSVYTPKLYKKNPERKVTPVGSVVARVVNRASPGNGAFA